MVKWLVLALVAWIGLSLVLFLISAQVNQDQVSAAAQAQLSDGGVGILKPQTTLILGSDQRTAGTKEPGASTSGPSRSDSILLVRTGGGHSAKLSIPRDTVVDIPGHGRNKINAAYAIGGAALTVQTVKQYLGISIDHVFEVNFDNFPALVDAMGGINYTGGCVVSTHQRRLQERRLHPAPAAAGRRTSTASRRSPSRARATTTATPRRTTSRARAASRRSSAR